MTRARSTPQTAWLRALAVAATLAGCQFDATLPANALVRCDDGRCPQGFVCRPRVGLCVPTAGAGSEAPRLTATSVTPARARDQDTVRATVSWSAPLAAPPQLTLLTTGGSQPLALVEANDSSASFTLRVDARQQPEGAARVLADLVGADGVEAVAQPVGVVELDFTPPRVLASTFTAPRGADDAGVLRVRPGEAVALSVSLSEPPRATARLAWHSACDAGPGFALRTAAGSLLDFAAPLAGADGCAYALSLDDLQDVAGNGAGPVPLSPRLVVDGRPPDVSGLELLAERDGGLVPATLFSRRPGFDRFVLRFQTDATAATLEARLDDARLSCACDGGACACAGQVPTAASEGPHTFGVTAEDGAGNATRVSTQALFDFTPPGLVSATRRAGVQRPAGCPLPSVTLLGPGGVAEVSFSLDEPGSAGLDAPDGGWRVTPAPGTSTSFAFSVEAPASAPSGPVPLRVRATDVVGNDATLPLGVPLALRGAPPDAPDVSAPGAVVYRRAPWGERDAGPHYEVLAADGVVPADTTLQVLDGLAPLALRNAEDGGALVATLPPLDRPSVSVRLLDSACNASLTVPVRDVEWLATLRGKAIGRSFENPHRAALRTVSSAEAEQSAASREVVLDDGVTAQGLVHWRQRGLWPAARYGPAAFHDPVRGAVLAFGGSPNGPEDELWEWAAGAWTNQTPTPRPALWPSGADPAHLAYDARRQRAVLLGPGNTLWELEPSTSTWRNRTPAPLPAQWPPSRSNGAVVFDSTRGTVLLFGGSGLSGFLDDLWEWSPNSGAWTDRTPAVRPTSWPPPRRNHRLAYDAQRQRVLLFGGAAGSTYRDDLWVWSPATGAWTNLTPTPRPAGWPGPRQDFGLAFDDARDALLVFGGATPSGYRADLFEWSPANDTWTNRTPAPLPPRWPTPRLGFGVAFDDARHRLLLFAGQDTLDNSSELWELDPATASFAKLGPSDAGVPSARSSAALAYDTARGRAVLFGGQDGQTVLDELWEWDGQRWVDRTPSPRPPSWPQARTGHTLTYDGARGRVVLFGGIANTLRDELWELEPDAGAWTNRTPSPRPTSWPSARNQHSAFFDAERQRVVVACGSALAVGSTDELWEWSGADGGFTRRGPPPGAVSWPQRRAGTAMVFDGARRRGALVGGFSLQGPSDELWRWDGTAGSFTELTPTPRPATWPAPRSAHVAVYDEARDVIVVATGADGVGDLDDTWAWSPATARFEALGVLPRSAGWPVARSAAAAAYDARRQRVLLVGGQAAAPLAAGPWELEEDATSRPGVAAQFDFVFAAAAPGAQVLEAQVRAVAGGSSAAAPGVRLRVTSVDALAVEATAAHGLAAPGALAWSSTSAARLATLFEGPERRVTVEVSPQGNNALTQRAAVRLDWVELRVRYRQP